MLELVCLRRLQIIGGKDMNERFEKYINILIAFFVVELIVIIIGFRFFDEFLLIVQTLFLVINGVIILIMLFLSYFEQKRRTVSIQQVLGKEAKEALSFGEIGLVTVDENYIITWMSSLFDGSASRFIGEKISSWIPEVSQLIRGSTEEVLFEFKNRIYKVVRHKEGQTFFFKDVTRQEISTKNYENNKVVLGLVHFDNYEEETQYEDEQQTQIIDTQLRQPVVKWAKDRGIFLRRIRTDRYLLVLNEEIFSRLIKEDFEILNQTRKSAEALDLSITLSMGFGKGTKDFAKLEEFCNQALELTQGRGGDQVAVKSATEEVKYYGSGSQAQEKGSKVRARVMANAIKDMVLNSENVIIIGHKVMDFDCFGAALGLSKIIQSYGKHVSIITKSGGIEEKLAKTVADNYDELSSNHHFVDEDEALSLVKPSTLSILVDHHNYSQTNGKEVIKVVGKVAVIDHHRRTSAFEFDPILSYIETSCSSSCEMISELFLYQKKTVELSLLESTILFTGIVIDTNHFRTRTGSRTFEAVANLKKLGADPQLSDSFLKETYEEFELKSDIESSAIRFNNYILIAYDKRPVNRTIVSQVADQTLKIADIEASFVIAPITNDRVGVSARSNGTVNVQRIMEELGGGGHFNAAAYQSDTESVLQLYEKIYDILNKESEKQNESNTTQ